MPLPARAKARAVVCVGVRRHVVDHVAAAEPAAKGGRVSRLSIPRGRAPLDCRITIMCLPCAWFPALLYLKPLLLSLGRNMTGRHISLVEIFRKAFRELSSVLQF